MYYALEICSNEYSLNGTIGRDVRTRKFGHLHLHHFVHLPHHYHSLENSRTFQDLALKFPGLSRTKPIFQDLEIVPKKIQDFPGAWEPCHYEFTSAKRGAESPYSHRTRRHTIVDHIQNSKAYILKRLH